MIRVTDDYVIDVDPMGYTVEKDEHKSYFNKQQGKEVPFFTNLAYFGKIEHAVRYVAERIAKDKINEKEEMKLSEAARKFKEAYQIVDKALRDTMEPNQIN